MRLGGEFYRKPIDDLKRKRLDADCEEHYNMLFEPKKKKNPFPMKVIFKRALVGALQYVLGSLFPGKSLSI